MLGEGGAQLGSRPLAELGEIGLHGHEDGNLQRVGVA